MVDKRSDRLTKPMDPHPLDTQGFERPRMLLQAIEEDLSSLLMKHSHK